MGGVGTIGLCCVCVAAFAGRAHQTKCDLVSRRAGQVLAQHGTIQDKTSNYWDCKHAKWPLKRTSYWTTTGNYLSSVEPVCAWNSLRSCHGLGFCEGCITNGKAITRCDWIAFRAMGCLYFAVAPSRIYKEFGKSDPIDALDSSVVA